MKKDIGMILENDLYKAGKEYLKREEFVIYTSDVKICAENFSCNTVLLLLMTSLLIFLFSNLIISNTHIRFLHIISMLHLDNLDRSLGTKLRAIMILY